MIPTIPFENKEKRARYYIDKNIHDAECIWRNVRAGNLIKELYLE